MMIDSSVISCLQEELNRELAGGHVDKIQQPAKDLVLLTVRSRGKNRKLLLSAASGKARAHLTDMSYESPQEPPMFCMLLRKHILGSEILSFDQPGGDRLLSISLRNYDDLGRDRALRLVVEMIPGKSNIILVGADGLIIDCAYRRDPDPDLYRRVYPGMIYRYPQRPEGFVPPEKENSFTSDEFSTLSEFLDSYYSSKEKEELYKRKSKELRNSLISAQKRITKKLAAQRIELQRTAERESVRRHAELITANIWQIKKGASSFTCDDYFAEGCPQVTLPLDPLLSPQSYAAKLFKEYNRQKTAEEYLTVLIEKAEGQLEYIASVLEELSRAESDRDISDIRDEVLHAGIIRQKGRTQNKKEKPQQPMHILSQDGFHIYAGKNNTQNDDLTFRTANRNDLWFHIRNHHGSHVLLRCYPEEPSPQAIALAAAFAVWASQGREATNVQVDYTKVRFVKKPPGALPGNVIYTDYTSILVGDWRDYFSPSMLKGK